MEYPDSKYPKDEYSQNNPLTNELNRVYIVKMINSFITEDIPYLISQTNKLDDINKKTKIFLDKIEDKRNKNIEEKL